jgi:hypothetical protein
VALQAFKAELKRQFVQALVMLAVLFIGMTVSGNAPWSQWGPAVAGAGSGAPLSSAPLQDVHDDLGMSAGEL